MVQWRKNNRITAALEYNTNQNTLELIRPIINHAQKLLGIKPPQEQPWQTEIRYYDLNQVGIFGHSLDIIGYTAASAQLHYVDPQTHREIPNPILQNKINEIRWRDKKDIYQITFAAVRALASVGEFDLIYDEKQQAYDIFHTSQRIQKKSDDKQIAYQQRENNNNTDIIYIKTENIKRCFMPSPGANHEAYSPARRILPELRLYAQTTRQLQRIAFSNSLMTKLLYLGIDTGTWEQNEEYTSQFGDPTQATPPIVNDMTNLAKEIHEGNTQAPWYPTMGDTPPQAIDLTTSFDEQALKMREQCNRAIAEGLNIPARLILSNQETTHFSEWAQDEQFRNYSVAPPLIVWLNFADEHIFSPAYKQDGINAKLWYSFDHIAKSSLNPAQLIEMFKAGLINKTEILKQLSLPERAGELTTEDIQFRRELVTGDSGLQQAQLAQRYGIDAQAVKPDAPLNNGNKRETQQITATIKKKT